MVRDAYWLADDSFGERRYRFRLEPHAVLMGEERYPVNNIASSHHYNPDWLSDDDLVANFVARIEEFTFLRNELARPFLGQCSAIPADWVRGTGKTTLLE